MVVHYGIDNLRIENPFVTIGSFDGVHRGHLHIINALRSVAAAQGAASVVVTFDTHPRQILNPCEPNVKILSSIQEKIELLDRAGVDHLVILPFNREMADLSYRDFVEQILIGKIGMKGLVVGYDHQFGKNREGNFEKLCLLATELGFYISKETPFSEHDVNISSTKIRNALNAGDVVTVTNYLGYVYSCRGKVVKGCSYGRTIGFPTANIALDDENKMLPGNGVYAIKAECEGHAYCGMLDIGTRPTVHENGVLSIEANLFGLDDDIYGKELKIYFISRMRDEMKFNSCEELVEQLHKDKEQAIAMLE